MPGVDEVYVRARRTLLDALEALRPYRDAIILVGAQAIYMHTGESDLAVAPFTTDADLALDPDSLATEPALETTLRAVGFAPSADVSRLGTWTSQQYGIDVDLLVPQAVGGRKGRGAHLEGHGDKAARQAQGLEAALVDRQPMVISALEESDPRQVDVNVAGPAALLIAKLYKLHDRRGSPTRQDNKDALDVYRLLRAFETQDLAEHYAQVLQEDVSKEVASAALTYLEDLFGTESTPGSEMAGQAVIPLDDPEIVAASCAALAKDLAAAVRSL